MAPAKDVVPATAKEVVTIDGELTSNVVLQWFRDPASVPHIASFQEDPEAIAARITAQQMGAESANELFGSPEILHGKEQTNKPFQFLSVHYTSSGYEEGEGLPFYGVYSVATVDGEVKVMTCGAKSVVLKLAKADAEGWLPLWLKLTKSDKATPGGFYPLDIVSAKGPDVKEPKAF